MPRMTKEDLVAALSNSPAMRAKFMANAIRFYEDIGVEITSEDIKRIDQETLTGLKAKFGDASAKAMIIVWPTIFGDAASRES